MNADGLPPLREVVRREGLDARRSLGQNFLFDLNLTGRIARAAAPLAGTTVIEVGPGPGGLTRALLAEGATRVVAIERDRRFRPALEEIAAAYPGRLEIVEADALEVDTAALAGDGPAQIVSNLPYNVGTALLVRWLEHPVWPPFYERLTLMFQREVAERIVAGPESHKDYGRLSVLAGWRTEARLLFDVPPSAFTPQPKVTSSVVRLVPRAHPEPCRAGALTQVAKAAFGQRRKMLRQSLKGLPVDAAMLLERVGLDPTLRAEDVPVAGFVALAVAMDAISRPSA